MDENFSGSAVITADNQNGLIVALGKASQTYPPPQDPAEVLATRDFFTIFRGEAAGASQLAFPYVRYANDNDHNNGTYRRSYLAVRNLESSQIKVSALYYDKDGNYCGGELLTIPENGKANTSAVSAGAVADENGDAGNCSGLRPFSFGYYQDGSFGGAVLLYRHNNNPNAKFIAINRTSHLPTGQPGNGEDVNGIPVP